jgi:hypothetical protein
MGREWHPRQWFNSAASGGTARWRAVGTVSAIAGLAASATVAIAASAVPAAGAATAPTALTAVTAVSCASATHCWAGGSDDKGAAIIATADGGATWRVAYATTRFDDVIAIDCTAIAHCIAIGDEDEGAGTAFLETTDGGKAWSIHAAPKSLADAEALSCANGADCWAVGLADDRSKAAVARTTDGGHGWTPESVPALQTAMSSSFGISCTSGADCLVTGEGALTTTNGGRTWAKHNVPGGVPLGMVTCPSTKDCYAIFDVTSAVPSNESAYLYTSVNGGLNWKDVLASPRHVAGLGSVSCPSTSTCVAVGYGFTPPANRTDELYALSELTSTSGRHWVQTTAARAQALFAVSCVAKTRDCVAGGETRAGTAVILKSANDGVTWTSEPLPRA